MRLSSNINRGLKDNGDIITIKLNDKILPIDRGEVYEDPLDEFLRLNKYGEVTGGGTMLQDEAGEIEFCDLEVLINSKNNMDMIINEIIKFLEIKGAPKGSLIIYEETSKEKPFGKREGLAVYLDAINLSEEVYKECDINCVIQELGILLGTLGEVFRYWQDNSETALYYYGNSFEVMRNSISEFIKAYPLCHGARVVQIA